MRALSRDQFLDQINQIADEIAAPNADDVDRAARFPQEAVDALREMGALSALVPEHLGGGGLSMETVAQACHDVGRRCGSTGMVFAMHQIQVAAVARHLDDAPWFADYLRHLARDQRLIASVTSEVGTGGDMGRSVAAMSASAAGRVTFEKRAPTVSYGAHADDLLVTLRRSPEADAGDQVIVLAHKDQLTLEQTGTWDPLGMRGTCSPGYVVRADIAAEQVLPTPFTRVASESMVPISHILWSHVWLGIATDAFERARAFVRAAARQRPNEPSPMAPRLSHVLTDLSLLRAEVSSGLRDFLDATAEPNRAGLSTMAAILRFNVLKVAASDQAPRICQAAMAVCGIVGYKNDTPFSVGRHVRDTMSASLMIANERIHETNGRLLLITKEV